MNELPTFAPRRSWLVVTYAVVSSVMFVVWLLSATLGWQWESRESHRPYRAHAQTQGLRGGHSHHTYSRIYGGK